MKIFFLISIVYLYNNNYFCPEHLKPGLIKTKFYGHGKLLLTGEYAVLDGAKALGLPTIFGQKLVVKRTTSTDLIWESLDMKGKPWFESSISLFDFSPVSTTDENISEFLKKFLKNAIRLNSEFCEGGSHERHSPCSRAVECRDARGMYDCTIAE